MNELKQLLYYKLDDFVKRADSCADADWEEQQLKAVVKMMAEDVKFLVSHFKELLDNKAVYEGLVANDEKISNKKRAVVRSGLQEAGGNAGGEE